MINEYFLKTEGCTFEEFCNVYNNGEKIYGNLKFTNFPPEILDALIPTPEELIPEPLYTFLTEREVIKEFIQWGFEFRPERMHKKEIESAGMEAIGHCIRVRDNKWLKLHQDFIKYYDVWLDRNEKYLPDYFRNFLKENGAYEMYLANIPRSYKNAAHFRRTNADNILKGHSFMWSATEQGKPFWSDLNNKLQEYVAK